MQPDQFMDAEHPGEELSVPEFDEFLGQQESLEELDKFGKEKDGHFWMKLYQQTHDVLDKWEEIHKNKVEELQMELTQVRQEVAEMGHENTKQLGVIEHLKSQPAATTISQYKKTSMKQPDPELFTGADGDKYDLWKLAMKGKFQVNRDHFEIEADKMVYFFNRTSGQAQVHLQPRYEEGAAEQFTTTQEMFEHLDRIYLNPFEVEEAGIAFTKLKMKTTSDYLPFYTEFLHLAGKAKKPHSELLAALTSKLSPDLHKAVRGRLTQIITLEELHKECNFQDAQLRADRVRAERVARMRNNQNASRAPATPSPAPKTTSSPAYRPAAPAKDSGGLSLYTRVEQMGSAKGNVNPNTGKPRPTYDDPVLQERSDKGLCLGCGDPDHKVAVCPKRHIKREAPINAFELDEDEDSEYEDAQAEN
jgi:hypothetical protein